MKCGYGIWIWKFIIRKRPKGHQKHNPRPPEATQVAAPLLEQKADGQDAKSTATADEISAKAVEHLKTMLNAPASLPWSSRHIDCCALLWA